MDLDGEFGPLKLGDTGQEVFVSGIVPGQVTAPRQTSDLCKKSYEIVASLNFSREICIKFISWSRIVSKLASNSFEDVERKNYS